MSGAIRFAIAPPAHDAGKLGGAETLVHDATAQRADAGCQHQPEHARPVGQDRAGQQRAVDRVDHPLARDDVAPAHPVVALQQVGPARIVTEARGPGDELGRCRCIAQTQVQPLGADRREHVGGLAEQHDPVAGKGDSGVAAHRKELAPSDARDDAEIAMELRLQRPGEVLIRHRGKNARPLRALQPHEARALAGHRHGGERAGLLVILHRRIAMRRPVVEARGERHLVVGPLDGADARRGANDRVPPVGAQHHPGTERTAASGAQQGRRARRLQAHRLVGQESDAEVAGAPFQRRRQNADRDIPAEGLVPDLAGIEDDGRGRHQARGIVDELEPPQRSRLLHDVPRPDAEMGQKADRGLHQGDRARIVLGDPRPSAQESHRQPGLGHEAARRQPRGAGADHRDICTLDHQFTPCTGAGRNKFVAGSASGRSHTTISPSSSMPTRRR
jgi:hypothetical protein